MEKRAGHDRINVYHRLIKKEGLRQILRISGKVLSI